MYRHILALAAGALIVAFASNAQASERYKWCAYYGGIVGSATNCGFNTFAQCQATISGVGGTCQPNPAYRGRTTEGRSRKQVERY